MDFFANFQVVLPDSMRVADWQIQDGVMATGITVILLGQNAAGEPGWVKVPNRNYLHHDELASRFEREVHLLEQLRGPWFPRYLGSGRYEAGPERDIPWLATEPAAGEILADIIRKDSQAHRLPSPDAATRLIRSLASALVEVHGRGIVHRNLRPACISIAVGRLGVPGPSAATAPKVVARSEEVASAGERVQIFDFVLGRSLSGGQMTRENAHIGSWRYSAPEQLQHASQVDGRADLFSLGVIAYEYLTHQAPYPSARDAAEASPPKPPSALNPNIPPELDELLLSLVSPDPDRR
ncbi:MAG: serine/threonine-protein kinase, partial [Candidatus Xenobia bacterium]